MKTIINTIVILATLAITGWLKMPFEQRLAEQMHELKLVPPRLSLEERSKLKQKAFIATYGSLRPTIAAFSSVQTTQYHSNQEWDKIENAFSEIVLLDPYNLYYWETASWHMAANAAVDRKNDQTLTEVARNKEFKKYIQKGKDIIEKGIKINPDNWQFLNLKARLQSNRYRNPNYHAAIKTYREILKTPELSFHHTKATEFSIQQCLLQIPEMHQESYDNALRLFHTAPQYKKPTTQNAIFVGQNHPLNKVTKKMSLEEIYRTPEEAYRILKIKWQRRKLGQTPYAVEKTIKQLENKLQIPNNKRVFPLTPLFLK